MSLLWAAKSQNRNNAQFGDGWPPGIGWVAQTVGVGRWTGQSAYFFLEAKNRRQTSPSLP